MMWTFSLAFIALCMGGVLDEMGFLKALVMRITQLVHKVGHLITVTIFSGVIANAALGEAYLSIILNGRLYRKAFEKKNLQNRMLSRVIEEGATMSTSLIPWTTAGAFMAGTLGVSPFAYAPYAVLNWINPLLSIVLGYCGIFVLYTNRGSGDRER
jgi:NhaC family Na+:H+ antiporter